MRLSTLSLLAGAPLVIASPFKFPLRNGFPFPHDSALEKLFTRAGGNFTNMPLAPKFNDDSLTSWKLQAFNEFMEVAFFTQLIANITERVPGYELDPDYESFVLESLDAIQAQEQLHAYNANDAVRYFADGSHIYPCTYVFPVSDFPSAIAFAQTFTDMYLGLLTNIQQRTAASLGSDSSSIIYVLSQALGAEGQQSGLFRSLLQKPASAEPFLTTSTRDLHFSYLQQFIVPGSCPNMCDIPLGVFGRMDILAVEGEFVEFLVHGDLEELRKGDTEGMRIAYINGALVPTVVPFEIISISHRPRNPTPNPPHTLFPTGLQTVFGRRRPQTTTTTTHIRAPFPYAKNVMHGLTIATVVSGDGAEGGFVSAEDVAMATVFGPGVIEVG